MSHHETVAGADDQVLTPHVFPQLDAVRALAAAMVVATHAAFWTGHYQGGVGSYLLTRLDSGVALFFVLSAFLLSRPYFLTRAWLRIDPSFAPLKGYPRFDRLVGAAGK